VAEGGIVQSEPDGNDRSAQARRVVLSAERQRNNGQPPQYTIVVKVKNDSWEPINELKLAWHQGAADRGTDLFEGALNAADVATITKDMTSGPSGAVSASPITVTLLFRDAAGVTWQLEEDGTLEEISGT
jgi:hypothetical protein